MYKCCFINIYTLCFGGDTRIRTGDQSFADSCLTTWLYRHKLHKTIYQIFCFYTIFNFGMSFVFFIFYYMLLLIRYDTNFKNLYNKIWSGKRGSNPRPLPWQGSALSTELFPHMLLFPEAITIITNLTIKVNM